MARFYKICGSKSGRCDHVILELKKKEEDPSEQKNDILNIDRSLFPVQIKCLKLYAGIYPWDKP